MIKVSNKKLAVKYPSVTMYPHHAHLFAVMEGIGVSDKDMLAWLAANYIMVQKGPDNLDFSTGYEILTSLENCPMLECLCVPLIIAEKRYADIIDLIKEMTDAEMYLYLCVDEYSISAYDNYGKNHIQHTLLIYGYDNEKQIVYAADFFKNRKYAFEEVSFEEIKNACDLRQENFLGGIRLLRRRPYYVNRFNLKRMQKNIEKYITGQPPEEFDVNNDYIRVCFNRSPMLYGINIYDGIIADIDKNDYVNIKDYFFIKQHFEVILKLYIYLAKAHMLKSFDVYADALYNSCDRAEMLLNMALMYNVTRRENQKVRLKELLSQFKNTDKYIMSGLLKNLGETNFFYVDTSSTFLHEINGLKLKGAKRKGHSFLLNDDGSFVQASFYGKAVKLNFNLLSETAVADIYIDAVKVAAFSFDGRNSIKHSEVFDKLSDSPHIVRITNCGGSISVKNISSIEPSLSHGSAKFICTDKQKGGRWKGNYGKLGYILPDYHKYPLNASVSFFDENIYSDDSAKETKNMLENIDGNGRIKKCFCREKEQILRVEAAGSSELIFTVYLLDWTENGGVSGELLIKDIADNRVLDRYDLHDMENGCYISYKVSGVTEWHIKLSSPVYSDREYGDIFGCFFDNVSNAYRSRGCDRADAREERFCFRTLRA